MTLLKLFKRKPVGAAVAHGGVGRVGAQTTDTPTRLSSEGWRVRVTSPLSLLFNTIETERLMFLIHNDDVPAGLSPCHLPTGSTAGVTGTLPFSVMTVSDLWRLASISLAPWRGQVGDIQIRLKRMTSPFPDIAVDDLRIVTEAEVLP